MKELINITVREAVVCNMETSQELGRMSVI